MIKKSVSRIFSDSVGVAAVEFALISVLFFILMIFSIQLGLYTFQRNQISAAIDAAARNLLVGSSGASQEVLAQVQNKAMLYLEKTNFLGDINKVTFFMSTDANKNSFKIEAKYPLVTSAFLKQKIAMFPTDLTVVRWYPSGVGGTF